MVRVRTAVSFIKLYAMFFHLFDGSNVDSIGADHFHMFTNLAQVRHARSPDIVSAERSECRFDPAIGSSQLAGCLRSPLSWSFYAGRSEEHTSELQSLMRITYAVFCLKKKIKIDT